MKTKLFAWLLVVLMAISLTACATSNADASAPADSSSDASETSSAVSETSDNNETIEVWMHWEETTGPNENAWWKKKCAEYAEENGVTVNLTVIPLDDYLYTKLPTAFATGSGPDVFNASAAVITQFINSGVTLDLAPYMSEELKADFTPTAFEGVQIGDSIYAIPFEADLFALFYNKDMLAEAGIEVPKTWSELKNAAVALTTDTTWGLTLHTAPGVHSRMEFPIFVWQQGKNLIEADGTSNLNSPETIKALQYWHDLMASGGLMETGGDMDAMKLIGEETAMIISGTPAIAQFEEDYPDFPVGVAHIPLPDEGGEYASVAGGWKACVNSASSCADTAADLVLFLFGQIPPTNAIEWCTEAKFAYSPRTSVIETASEIYSVGLREFFSTEINPVAHPELAIDGDVASILDDMLQDALFNTTAEEAAANAEARYQQYLSQNNG